MRPLTPIRSKRQAPENVPTIKRKRRSGDLAALGLNAHESRYTEETQKGYYEKVKAPWASDKKKMSCVAAVKSCWDNHKEFVRWKAENVKEDCDDDGVTVSVQMGKEMLEENKGKKRKPLSPGGIRFRRFAIQYFYELYGSPPESSWGDFDASSLPTLIMKHLAMPEGSYASVIDALHDIIEANKCKKGYDPSMHIKAHRGAKSKIHELTPQAAVVYRTRESGLSLNNTVVVLNKWRAKRNLGPVSYSTVQSFAAESSILVTERRQTRKAGSTEVGSDWSLGRNAFACQLIRQFNKGKRIAAGGNSYDAAEDGPEEQAALERPIFLNGGVCGVDQVHFHNHILFILLQYAH
jgi:hypothetical protein